MRSGTVTARVALAVTLLVATTGLVAGQVRKEEEGGGGTAGVAAGSCSCTHARRVEFASLTGRGRRVGRPAPAGLVGW